MAKKNEYIPQTVSHPGATLGAKIQELQMSVKEFAVLAHVPESLISAVINGRTSITLELANAIEKVTNIPSKFWIARQSNYDESLVKQRVEAKRESGVLKIAGTAV